MLNGYGEVFGPPSGPSSWRQIMSNLVVTLYALSQVNSVAVWRLR